MRSTSQFFSTFSLRHALSRPEARQDISVTGFIGGGGGASSSSGPGFAQHSRTENFRIPLVAADRGFFKEETVLSPLKETIEKAILESGASVLYRGTIDGRYYSSEFFYEYEEGPIQGRLLICGKTLGDGYGLRSTLDEVGPAVLPSHLRERRIMERHVTLGAEARADRYPAYVSPQPAGTYSVIPFLQDNPWSLDDNFYYLAIALLERSRKRLGDFVRAQHSPANIPVEIWAWTNNLQQLRFLGSQGPALDQAVQEEFRQYAKIFFLNEGALRMFKDATIRLNVLREISAEEMPIGCHQNIRAVYFPY